MTSFFPIRELSAYHGKWTIKARVTSKAKMREFTGRNGKKGSVFSADLLDQTAEIRASFFNAAADKYYEMLKPGQMYTFSRGSVKVANKRFNSINHPYEITFDSDATEVKEAQDDHSIDAVKYNFHDLRAVQAKPMPCVVDLCVVVKGHKELMRFTAKSGENLVKRELIVCDDTEFSMDVTVWGEKAENLNEAALNKNPVVLIKAVSVKEWNERSGSVLSGGGIDLSPSPQKYEQVARLTKWWNEQGGSSKALVSLSNDTGDRRVRNLDAKSMSAEDMKQASNLVGEIAEFYSVRARLVHVVTAKQGEPVRLYYKACQSKIDRNGRLGACNKRVDDRGYCPSCGKETTNQPRYMARCRFVDHTDSFYVNLFDADGERVLGRPASDFMKADEANQKNEPMLRPKYLGAPLEITLSAKVEKWQDEQRSQVRCLSANPVSLAQHGKKLLGEIYEMVKTGVKPMEVGA